MGGGLQCNWVMRYPICDMTKDIFDETLALLGKCDLPRAELARRSGLNENWLKALKAGRIEGAPIKRIQRLHRFLKAQAKAA